MPLPLPVTVISGFLGAGKTTLINRMLAGEHGLRLAILVNDFGEIALDQSLITGQDEDVIALANGCMCCQIGGALYDSVDKIISMADRFDQMVIETSGVADPNKISQIAIAEPDLRLLQTVILVDYLNADDVRSNPMLADSWERQVRAGDLIIVTKADQSNAIEFKAFADGLSATAPVGTVIRSDAAELTGLLLEESFTAPKAGLPGSYSLDASHADPFASWSWQGEIDEIVEVDKAALRMFLETPALGIYRAKGVLKLTDGSNLLVHKVGRQITIEPCEEWTLNSCLICIGARRMFDAGAIGAGWQKLLKG